MIFICKRTGKFFSVRSSSGVYTAELSFSTIDLAEQSEHYLIRFYNLYLCDNHCLSAQDLMSIKINDQNGTNLLTSEYYERDFEMKQVWIKRELTFKTWSNKINVRFIHTK